MSDESRRHVIVMGLARSGHAVAKLLCAHGFDVIVNDHKQPEQGDAVVAELSQLGCHFVFGGHPLELLSEPLCFIVKNPGIPYRVPLLQEAMQRRIPIYTEVEVASWYAQGEIAAITGSNGKTTTTSLVGEMLAADQRDPIVAGNIGTAFSAVTDQTDGVRPIVLEVSSFQLMGTDKFHPHVASILNLYPAHLDYHGDFDAYVQAKWKVFANQTPADFAVLNYEDLQLRRRAQGLVAQVVWFTEKPLPQGLFGAYVEDGRVFIRTATEQLSILRVTDILLPGAHNLQNALAATLIAWLMGSGIPAIRQVLQSFRGVEHRMEYVRTVADVTYYNDSKSTNPTAALQALRSFTQPIVWIAGGLDRQDDYSVLFDVLRDRVKAAFVYGQTAADLAQFCTAAGVREVSQVTTLAAALEQAASASAPGDVVLLSPACASWDMFSSFEERGRMFKELVHRL